MDVTKESEWFGCFSRRVVVVVWTTSDCSCEMDDKKGIMKTELEKIGNNIRCLRIAYGETQEDLGEAIGVEKSTISNYENGIREPTKEKLSAIATHYMVSVEELLTFDYSGIGRFNINPRVFWENIDQIFPIAFSEKASKNKYFKRAHFIHCEVFEQFKNEYYNNIDKLIDCLNEYLEAYEFEEAKCESAANFIGIWYLFIFSIKNTPAFLENKPAAILQAAKNNKNFKNMIEEPDPDLKRDAKEMLDDLMVPETEELISELLTSMKQSKLWYPLADYYLAMRYVWNLVDNGLEFEINNRIGIEMLDSFAMVENPYARYLLSLK